MSLRRTIVEVEVDGLNVRQFCAQHGISTWFFYELRRRVAVEGLAGLEPRSRAPRRVANKTSPEVEDAIVALRKELVDAGLDAGAGTIVYHLHARGAVTVSEATAWRVLRARGFIEPDPSKRPKHAGRRFAAERANECWQIDDTGWELVDGTPVKIIDVVDDCSRVAVACHAVGTCTAVDAFDAFATGAQEWGWPERFLSDNAKAFRNGLAKALGELGIAAGHSRPYHPQTCGKVERFHQTLKLFLSAQPPVACLVELQMQLDAFRATYNHLRPHRSLQRRIPAEVWAQTPKSGPRSRSLTAATRVHRGTVARNGLLSAGRGVDISLGSALAGRPAIAVVTGTAAHVFVDGALVRAVKIDPTRRVQPLYSGGGRPPRV
jgi:transposase InsO family protein